MVKFVHLEYCGSSLWRYGMIESIHVFLRNFRDWCYKVSVKKTFHFWVFTSLLWKVLSFQLVRMVIKQTAFHTEKTFCADIITSGFVYFLNGCPQSNNFMLMHKSNYKSFVILNLDIFSQNQTFLFLLRYEKSVTSGSAQS